MLKEGPEEVWRLLLLPNGFPDFDIQVFDVPGHEVRQITVLGVVPDLLGRIQVGCVGRQPFKLEPSRMFLFKEFRR